MRERRDDSLSNFPEPPLDPWVFNVPRIRIQPGPLWVTAGLGSAFFLTIRPRVESGDHFWGWIAVAGLALILATVVLITIYAETDPTWRKRPPEPRSRAPNAGPTRGSTRAHPRSNA